MFLISPSHLISNHPSHSESYTSQCCCLSKAQSRMPYFILYNKNYLMLLEYKGREAGQSSTFTICRLKKKKKRRKTDGRKKRKKRKQQQTTHMNAHLLINTLKEKKNLTHRFLLRRRRGLRRHSKQLADHLQGKKSWSTTEQPENLISIVLNRESFYLYKQLISYVTWNKDFQMGIYWEHPLNHLISR